MKSQNLFVLFLFLFVSALQAQVANEAKAADEYLTSLYKATEPGASVLVVKDGKVILRKGYGLAKLDTKTPITPETIFRIGSVTKQFTSTAILKLAEQGKLNLQDEITKYLPYYPTQGKKITIEHLLTHTSGIKSYTNLEEAMTTQAKAKEISVDEMINVFKDKPFDFNPGDGYLYNNSGYFLLGAIIEKVSGITWGEYLKKNFFVPLKMNNTFYSDPKLQSQATGYKKEAEYSLADYVHPTVPYSAGAIFSTVDDLWKWEKAIFEYKVVKNESLEKAWTPLTLNNGKKESYGYGWALSKIGDDKVIGHGGGIDGFVCHELYVPASKLFITILENGVQVDPQNTSYEIANRLSGASASLPAAIILDDKTMDEYVGVYELANEPDRIITKKNNQLFSQRTGSTLYEMIPYGKDVFLLKGSPSRLKFNRNANGKISEAELVARDFINKVATKTDKPIPVERTIVDVSTAVFDQYVGEYQLAPSFIITVRREENKLLLQATGQPSVEMFAESETTFFLKVVDAKIEFRKNAEGKTESLTLFQGGQVMPGKKIK